MSQVITEKRLKEWLESPVAEALIESIKTELDSIYQARAECFDLDKPVETHIRRAIMIGEEKRLEDIKQFLLGDLPTIELYLEQAEITFIRED